MLLNHIFMKLKNFLSAILLLIIISNNSFSQSVQNSLKVFASGNEAIPGDRNVIICLKMESVADADRTIKLDLTGSTAINGKDFVRLPDSLIVPRGEQYKCFVINPYKDNSEKDFKIIKFRAKVSEKDCSNWIIKMRYTNKFEAYVEEEMNLDGD
jgi:hypothetical protein